MCLALCACGGAPPPVEADPLTAGEALPVEESEPAPAVEDNPFLAARFAVHDVVSGIGNNKLGTYGEIHVKKSDLPEFSSPEFLEYLAEFIEARVEGAGHNWVGIIFDDGTGFQILGNSTGSAFYGEVDNEGFGATYGVAILAEDGYNYEDYHIRTIPTPTLRQEAMISDNYFEPAPAEIFSTTAAENGLGDTAFYAEGEIIERMDVKGYDTIRLATEYGDLYVWETYAPFSDFELGDAVTVFFVYGGWSDDLDGAAGWYVHLEQRLDASPEG